MDFASLRNRLKAAKGEQFWRCLEELADDPQFRGFLCREYPRPDAPWASTINRRKFFTLMGASLALAGLSGCSLQPPAERIVPYVRSPEGLVPGRPLFYATAMTVGGYAEGVLVESHEGRPTKIEGNELHPASLGGSSAQAQASVLTLYDPDRSQNVTCRGEIRTWDDLVAVLQSDGAKWRDRKGAGLRLLTDTVTSPTLARQIQSLLHEMPSAKWHQYEPVSRDAARAGARQAFGQPLNTCFRFDKAEVVLSIDADFLASGPGHVRYARDFMAKRRSGLNSLRTGAMQSQGPEMNRLYVVQCAPTCTGAKADHCWPLRAADSADFARALAAKLDRQFQVLAQAPPQGIPASAIDALARDLLAHRGASIVIAGDEQPPAVHVLAHAMNHLLGNVGNTVIYTDPVEVSPVDQVGSLSELTDDMAGGAVDVLVIVETNPVLTAPADFQFAKNLAKVPLRIYLGLYEDETSALCHWHVPAAHYLESWSDARAYDGTASIIQPLIAPLYGGKTAHELLAVLANQPERPGYELVRAYWRDYWKSHVRGGGGHEDDFQRFWKTALHDGVVAGTALPPKQAVLKEGWLERLSAATTPGETTESGDALEIVFRADPSIFDGRWANNGWLQELPKPLSKLTWDNAALLSPATAAKFGLKTEPSGHGGDHGGATSDVVELQYAGRTLRAPVWIMPGHADASVTLYLGYGRSRAGNVGTGLGFNAYAIRTSKAPWFDSGLQVRRTGEQFVLACTQFDHEMGDRRPVHAGTLAEYAKNPHLDSQPDKRGEMEQSAELLPTMYPASEHPYEGYKWGMVIDLAACVGCNACVVACQAENNSPVVGKEQVLCGREMHWLRIDSYYRGGRADLETYFQPLPCMQCENAPCELVCPVGATVHSDEGLNDMVYNRCVGTRYCSNNCPYKVRRFNFFQFTKYITTSAALGRNPDVTVRSRGVMEKCTYCVQRITHARIAAEKEDRTIADGEVLTACQAACPAGAIVFGDLNDPRSRVAEWAAEARNYTLLLELNTRPRTTYLAALRNPNPKIEAT